jgi:predicted nucleic acid-binding protein
MARRQTIATVVTDEAAAEGHFAVRHSGRGSPMILYADTSALVKRYIPEKGAAEFNQLSSQAELIGTSALTRLEAISVFAKAITLRTLSDRQAARCKKIFLRDCPQFCLVTLTDSILKSAEGIAWEYRIRMYDALHLASALVWRQMLSCPVCLATFDDVMWKIAQLMDFQVFPAILPSAFVHPGRR